MYVNLGDRRIPKRIDDGSINLPAINPDEPASDAAYFQQEYDPQRLFEFLHNESDLSYSGLYLSIVGSEYPTQAGKRWFFRVPKGNPSGSGVDYVLRWVEKKDLRFWEPSFRLYTNLYQGRGIMDYSTYVSRSFGYAFIVGQTFYDDEEDVNLREFINFYPSLHHYHQNIMFNESELWRPVNQDYPWESFRYGMNDENPTLTPEGVNTFTQAYLDGIERVEDMGDLFDNNELDDEETED